MKPKESSKFGGVVKTKADAETSGVQVLEPPSTAKPGRPAGKRTDPNYRQVSAWVRKDTYDATTKRLIDIGRVEFSEAVQHLLELWLTGKVIVEKDRARVSEVSH